MTTVKYSIKRWKQSKDLTYSIRSDRPRKENESQIGSTNCFSHRTTDIRYDSRHRKQVDKDRNYSQREREQYNGA